MSGNTSTQNVSSRPTLRYTMKVGIRPPLKKMVRKKYRMMMLRPTSCFWVRANAAPPVTSTISGTPITTRRMLIRYAWPIPELEKTLA